MRPRYATNNHQTEEKIMKLLTATLVKPARQVETKYGTRTVADAIDQNGKEQTIWRPANDPVLNGLSVNSPVTLAVDSKGKISLVDNQPVAPATPKTETNKTEQIKTDYSLSKTDKQAIASYIQQQRDLLAFCWEQAKSIPGHESEDTTEKLAVTLYLAAQRKFNLA